MKTTFFWFRRDLRLEDNTALYEALSQKKNVIPLFIFDEDILNELPSDDPRVQFIHKSLASINEQLGHRNSSILILKGNPVTIWDNLIETYDIDSVFLNKDYEPYALKRDLEIKAALVAKGIKFHAFKDQVIHEESEVIKADGTPYTVFTPYKNKWLSIYKAIALKAELKFEHLHQEKYEFPSLEKLGLKASKIFVQDYNLSVLDKYNEARDLPGIDSTSYLGPHLRFGTVSVRQVIAQLEVKDSVFLSELIWREFFMQILFHFPKVVTENFRAKYDHIEWINNENDFEKWCQGETGYPLVDAGMKQLNKTGYMHNRVRMVTAGFLCKHLLVDWRLGEAYFAEKLLDYELSSNNGNWQWAAGTGCDAAPYFRIFNPHTQFKKFDKAATYVNQWLPEFQTLNYAREIVEHDFARKRALETYKKGIALYV